MPLIVFRSLMPLFIEGRAIMCLKSFLSAFKIGKQLEAHRIFSEFSLNNFMILLREIKNVKYQQGKYVRN